MQKSLYIKDTPTNREVMKRVQLLEQEYEVSFSEIVVKALKDLVAVKRPKVPNGDFRNAKLGLLR